MKAIRRNYSPGRLSPQLFRSSNDSTALFSLTPPQPRPPNISPFRLPFQPPCPSFRPPYSTDSQSPQCGPSAFAISAFSLAVLLPAARSLHLLPNNLNPPLPPQASTPPSAPAYASWPPASRAPSSATQLPCSQRPSRTSCHS